MVRIESFCKIIINNLQIIIRINNIIHYFNRNLTYMGGKCQKITTKLFTGKL